MITITIKFSFCHWEQFSKERDYKSEFLNILFKAEITIMNAQFMIRRLVEKALFIKQMTPEIENAINSELTRLGHVSPEDYEALELLMSEMDAGRISLVPSRSLA